MKTKNFQKYLESRLNKDELLEIEKQVEREVKILKSTSQEFIESLNTKQRKKFDEEY